MGENGSIVSARTRATVLNLAILAAGIVVIVVASQAPPGIGPWLSAPVAIALFAYVAVKRLKTQYKDKSTILTVIACGAYLAVLWLNLHGIVNGAVAWIGGVLYFFIDAAESYRLG